MFVKSLSVQQLAAFAAGVLICFFAVFRQAHALESDASKPIKLTADKASYSQKTGQIEYTGSVTVTQGTLKIQAARVQVLLGQDGGISSVVATGSPVTVEQLLKVGDTVSKGSAKRLSYNAASGLIRLQGGAKLTQNGASITGETIEYGLDAGDFSAERGSSSQVELVLPPTATKRLGSVKGSTP